jgi:hypothetical protein
MKFQKYLENDAKMDLWEQEKKRMMGGQGPEQKSTKVETDPDKIVAEPFRNLKRHLLDRAERENVNIILNDVKIWRSPVGNPSGLYDFQYQLIREKFKKSGARLAKKLNTIKKGDTIIIERYKNITRDRGKWVPDQKLKAGSK